MTSQTALTTLSVLLVLGGAGWILHTSHDLATQVATTLGGAP